jgi:release factor glutamine methyltransferase
LLAPKGRAVIEIGAGQDVAAGAILSAGGLRLIGQRVDLSGIVRCLILG